MITEGENKEEQSEAEEPVGNDQREEKRSGEEENSSPGREGEKDGEEQDLTKTSSEEEEEKDDESEEDEVEQLNAELDELKDKYLRLYAEFENYKKRTIRERVEMRKSASREVMSALLPVLDDFDRARESAEDESTDEVFSEGVELVYNKLYDILDRQGLKEMETDGEPFDSELHEAVSEIPPPSDDLKGKIVDTIEKGYFLNDRIIRHAKVVVGKD